MANDYVYDFETHDMTASMKSKINKLKFKLGGRKYLKLIEQGQQELYDLETYAYKDAWIAYCLTERKPEWNYIFDHIPLSKLVTHCALSRRSDIAEIKRDWDVTASSITDILEEGIPELWGKYSAARKLAEEIGKFVRACEVEFYEDGWFEKYRNDFCEMRAFAGNKVLKPFLADGVDVKQTNQYDKWKNENVLSPSLEAIIIYDLTMHPKDEHNGLISFIRECVGCRIFDEMDRKIDKFIKTAGITEDDYEEKDLVTYVNKVEEEKRVYQPVRRHSRLALER